MGADIFDCRFLILICHNSSASAFNQKSPIDNRKCHDPTRYREMVLSVIQATNYKLQSTS